jgi:hypothetical protein
MLLHTVHTIGWPHPVQGIYFCNINTLIAPFQWFWILDMKQELHNGFGSVCEKLCQSFLS